MGRQSENDIVVTDPKTPDIAVRLAFGTNGYSLENISLSAKVRLNGKKIKKALLRDHDSIEIGKCSYVFIPHQAEPSLQEGKNNPRQILEKISAYSETVGNELNLKALLEKTLAIFLDVIGGTDAFIFTIDGDGTPQVFVSSKESDPHRRFSDTVVQQVIASGEGLCIPNALSDPSFSHSQSISDLKLSSVLCCPIVVAKKKIGIVYLGSSGVARSFNASDLDMLKLFSSIAGILIFHVEYIAQQQSSINRLARASGEDGIVGQSKVMADAIKQMNAAAESNITILIEGETGTGKDLFAENIHKKSKHSKGNYIVVNCSSLHGELLESELFGHKKGAFTGAFSDHEGLFAAANGGTIFLDEIGEMSLETQSRLLRTLETGLIRHVGSSFEESVDFRIICATNRDLAAMVDASKFRKDLFYRLNQFSIKIPPLRDREDDAVLLAYFFLEKFKAEFPSKEIRDFTEESLRFARSYEWPGNVRELANAVHKAIVMSTHFLLDIASDYRQGRPIDEFDFNMATNEFQKGFIEKALRHCQGNKEKAALLLGMSRSTFFRYLASFDLN
jgi:Nif-specific regulatory protein